MPSKDEIQNEIDRKQALVDIYMDAGKVTEARILSAEVAQLLNLLRH